MHRLLAICVLLASATAEAHGHLFRHWVTRNRLPASWQFAAEALRAPAVDTSWSKAADDKGNSVMMYFVETKQELFVFGEAVPAPITTQGKTTTTSVPITSTSAPTTSTRAPATSTSAPTTSTSALPTSTSAPATSTSAPATSTSAPATSTTAPATSTSAPATSTTAPGTSTSAPATSTRTPATSTSAPTTSTRAPATSTSAPTTGSSAPATVTSAPTTSTNTQLPSSTIPPGYTYYSATGSYYKLHHEKETSWYDANATCASEGAHLTVLDDAVEADIVSRIVLDAVGEYEGTWLGVRDTRPKGKSDWRTVHGEPLTEVYHEWYAGRPYDDEDIKCAGLSPDSKQLFDRPCNDYLKWYVMCERSQ